MNVYRFQDEIQLSAMIRSGVIPAQILESTARYCVHEDSINIICKTPLSQETSQRLKQLQVLVDEQPDLSDTQEVRHWAELIKPLAERFEFDDVALVLFKLGPQQSLKTICTELLALGCDRQAISQVQFHNQSYSLLRVVKPPFYMVLKAMESLKDMELYVPAQPGQEMIWVKAGYAHKVLACMNLQMNNLVLVDGAGIWQYFPVPQWTDLYESLAIKLALQPSVYQAQLAETIEVQLRLVPQKRHSAANLWLINKNAKNAVESLFSQLTDTEINKLSFVVLQDSMGDASVVLKMRSRQDKRLTLALDAVACSPYGSLENLFLPVDHGLEPRIRPEKLQEKFASNLDQINIWIPRATAGIEVISLEYESFALLEDWLEYVLHEHKNQLQPWIKRCQFDFAQIETFGKEWSELKEKGSPDKANKERRERNKDRWQAEDKAVNEVVAKKEKPSSKILFWKKKDVDDSDDGQQQVLAQMERQFIELDSPAHDPERLPLWQALAEQYTEMKKDKEAAQCWIRLIWQDPQAGYEQEWLKTILQHYQVQHAASLVQDILKQTEPKSSQVRALASVLIAQTYNEKDRAEIKAWCDRHDNVLDVRSLWLLRLRLCIDSGNDVLQLVTTRDRVLARLVNGLSLSKDIPSFMRFCGSKQGDSLTVYRLQGELEKIRQQFLNSERNCSSLEAPTDLTQAYVDFAFAWGFARLNQGDRAMALFTQAEKRLDLKDSVHFVLSRYYQARMQQALQGLSRETPVEASLEQLLNQLERFPRYKIDRLRQVSHILEPQDRLDAFRGFQYDLKDSRGKEFQAIRGMEQQAELLSAIDNLLQQAMDEKDEGEQVRLLDGIMDFLPKLGEAQALPRLEKIIAELARFSPRHQGLLLEDTLILAGYYMRQDLIGQQLASMEQLLTEVPDEELQDMAGTLVHLMSSLRRVGLFDQGQQLLSKAYGRLDGLPESLLSRLSLAAGFIEMNEIEKFQELFMEALEYIDDQNIALSKRLQVVHLVCHSCAHLKVEWALERFSVLMQRLPQITDSYNTNSHFCLSVVQFMESIILGVASDQLVLGNTGGKWLGEDELLVRKKIQQDLVSMQKANER